VTPLVTAGAGFPLAVLWFDLMFDVQDRRPDRGAARVRVATPAPTHGAS
jgi:hypothetical protein